MPLSNLLSDLINDIHNPGILWQAGIIVLCAVAGWGLGYLARRTWLDGRGRNGVVRFGVESFAHVLSPLAVVVFLLIAKLVMARYQQVHLLRLAIPLFGSMAVIRLAFYLLRRGVARHGPVGTAILTFEKIFALLVWLGVALYITGVWPDLIELLETTKVPLGRHAVTLAVIGQAAVSVIVLLMLALWAGAALEERLMGMGSMHTSLRVVLARMSRAILIVVAVLLSLSLVGIDLTVLSVFGGALGVGLGLGLQKIASNYVSGFVILLERSLAIGDMIMVDKFSGKVTQINSRYTVLQALDGTESVLPNEMLISGAVQNLSLSNRQIRIATQVTVAFDTDLANFLPLLEQACVGVPRILAEPAPAAMLLRFGADGFDLELGMWIGDPENGRGGVLSEVNLKIWSLLQEQGVSLPYPTRDLRIADPRVSQWLDRVAPPQ